MKKLWPPLRPRLRQLMPPAVRVLGVVGVGRELGGRAPRDVTLRADFSGLARQGFAARSLRVELLDVDGSTLRRIERRADPGGALDVVRAPLSLPTGRWRTRVEVAGDARVLSREVTIEVEAGRPVEVPLPEL